MMGKEILGLKYLIFIERRPDMIKTNVIAHLRSTVKEK